MTGLLAVWNRRTGPERFESYTRWTLYALLGLIPFMVAAAVSVSVAQTPGARWPVAFLVLDVLQVAVAIAVIRRGITEFRRRRPQGRRDVLALVSISAVTVVVGALTVPPPGEVGWQGRGAAVTIVLATALFAMTPTLTSGWIAAASVGIGGIGVALSGGHLERPALVTVWFMLTIVVFAMAGSFRVSIWMLGIVWEQERSRQLQARLAVAEERLRFSRDLHDVVGRTLSAVALKSELAAELARRGKSEVAADQMLEIRELASGSLREVRAVVAGYRRADLTTELAGARAMLRSAGIATRVIGDESMLPEDVQAGLAWVVREGVTNVVRHAEASTCTIDLAVEGEPGQQRARLRLTNDGAPGNRHPTGGSGLVGLSERLEPLGGTIATSQRQGSFTLEAHVPLDGAGRPHAVEGGGAGAGAGADDGAAEPGGTVSGGTVSGGTAPGGSGEELPGDTMGQP